MHTSTDVRKGTLSRTVMVAALLALTASEGRAEVCRGVARGGRATCTLEHGGKRREYRIYVPASAGAPAPVVLNLHGRAGVAGEQETRLTGEADRAGFILVSPQGYERSWNAGVGFGPAHAEGLDDVGFVRAVIADLSSSSAIPIDTNRVFATGFSNGARMTHRLACEASDVIAAIATVAGPISDRTGTAAARAFECRPSRPVPVLMIHGERDKCTPYAGGDGLDTRGNVSTPLAAREWAERGACTTTTTHELGSTVCEVHGGCTDGAEVALCTVRPGGHVWPGGPRYPLWQMCGGAWPDDFDASAQLWSFFAAHPMPGASPAAAWQPLQPDRSRAGSGFDLDLRPVDMVELPFVRSEIGLTVRGAGPSTFDGAAGDYQDGALSVSGAISLYGRLRVRGKEASVVRVLTQFKLEGEGVRADLLGRDQRVMKGSLGLTAMYVSPAHNLYSLYAGAGIAETRETVRTPSLMPSVLGTATYQQSKRLTWIYGGGLGYALGRPWILPTAGVLWTFANRWTLSTILPLFVEVRHTVNRKLSLGVQVSVSGDRFQFANEGAFPGAPDTLRLQLGQGKLALRVGYRWNYRWSWLAEIGAVGPRTLAIMDGDAKLTSAEGRSAGHLSTSLIYAFGNAYR